MTMLTRIHRWLVRMEIVLLQREIKALDKEIIADMRGLPTGFPAGAIFTA